eukprot:4730824-Amphidinium_carterae.1
MTESAPKSVDRVAMGDIQNSLLEMILCAEVLGDPLSTYSHCQEERKIPGQRYAKLRGSMETLFGGRIYFGCRVRSNRTQHPDTPENMYDLVGSICQGLPTQECVEPCINHTQAGSSWCRGPSELPQ